MNPLARRVLARRVAIDATSTTPRLTHFALSAPFIIQQGRPILYQKSFGTTYQIASSIFEVRHVMGNR
jgi:hypothetical protein